jgi:hypothetical protein
MPAKHSNGWQKENTLEKLFCAWIRNPHGWYWKRKIKSTVKR